MSALRPRWRPNRLALAVLVGVSACSTLPTFEPEAVLAAAPAKPQLDGARGPLSPEQSKAVLAKLAARAPDTGIFDRHLAIEEAVVGSPLTVGNQATLLQDGPATYSAMFAAIESARDHINLETYILDDDEVGRRFADALIAKQKKGVQVNVIHDSVGTLFTPKEFFKRMTDAGIKVLEFNPVNPKNARKGWDINQRDHRKLLIVDGKVAFLGGINISSVYSSGSFSRSGGSGSGGSSGRPAPGKDGKAWRDTHVRLQGPVVAEYQRLFLSTWAKQKGAPLPERQYFPPLQQVGNQIVRAIGSSPDEPFSLIYATLLSAIGAAETSVHITMAYFAPDPQFLAALESAARRGVDVTLILPSQTDSWLIFHAGRRFYTSLLKAGVKIYERRGVILHSKTAVIDGVWATVGSTNLDWRSFLHNDELNAVVLGGDFGQQMEAVFAKDLAASQPVTLTEWKRRPLQDRMKETFASIWEYWL
ncbi:phospholipase D-like domain-containing protein [Rhizobacter sp. J219]|uniref:phospholipase D-like domain-containing protein n=1 Tax=Rhizobacter sp. J219 TaxID=2898430 RepID=UPI002150CFC8|nr:phospholipase D-like domain-containing protein [Rhizobacter sp. J219]MCR5881479.1 phospholipase D-like domain-containing protein [Rhizobacter sp. J219]